VALARRDAGVGTKVPPLVQGRSGRFHVLRLPSRRDLRQGDKELDQAGAQAFGKGRPSKQEIEQFASDTLVPNIQGQIDDVRALPPPQGDEEQVSAFLDSAQQALDKVEQDPSRFSARPRSIRGDDQARQGVRLREVRQLKEADEEGKPRGAPRRPSL
jgi:hypothetical protein